MTKAIKDDIIEISYIQGEACRRRSAEAEREIKLMKRTVIFLVLLAVVLTASPALTEWIDHASTSEANVRNPILVVDAADQPINPKEIDPEDAHIRKVTVSNISTRNAYMITPRLQVEYTTGDGQPLVAWEGTNPPQNPGAEFGASKWVVVSVFDDAGTYLTLGEAIILPPNASKTFTFHIWFTGDAWPGKYKFTPWVLRSAAPTMG